MTEQKKLSLCIITNNDEEYIHDCLRKIKDIADEIIIADIGSVDDTIAIARQEGAKVYQVKWNNDYSEIRNFCMDHAEGEWVFFLQPNETIADDHLQKIRALLENPNAEAYLVLINYNSESFRISSPVQSLRLFRNHNENRFCHRSFESIPDEKLIGVVGSTIEIVQLDDAMLSWELNSRRFLLWEEALENPQDSYLQYMLGLIKLNQSGFEESIVCFQNAYCNVNPGYLFAPHLYKCFSWAYLYLEQYDDAMKILNEGIEFCPFYTDLMILRAEIYKQLKQYDDAMNDLELCLRTRQCPGLHVPGPDINDSYVFALLGEISELTHEDEKALIYYVQAYQLDTTDLEILDKIGELIVLSGSEEFADDLLSMAVKQQNPDTLAAILKMLQKIHEYELILSHMNDIAPILGDTAMSVDVSCRLMAGSMTAEDDLDDCSFDVMFRRIENCWLHDNWAKADELLNKLDDVLPCAMLESNVFLGIHRLLVGETTVNGPPSQEAYDVTESVYHDLLWKGKEKEAKALLPMLLDKQEDDIDIKLALPWARIGDLDAIRTIFSHLSSDERKPEFIQRVIKELLRHEHPVTACKVKDLGGSGLPEALERLLRASCMFQELRKWMIETERKEAKTRMESILPDHDLMSFHRLICHRDGCGNSAGLTTADIHRDIGDCYMKSNKKTEAFLAYIRALQAEPWNFVIQQRAMNLIGEIPAWDNLLTVLENIDSGNWPIEKRAFVHYMEGLKDFYNGRFTQALVHFSQVEYGAATNRIFEAYAAACMWLDGNVGISQEDRSEICADLVILICLNYVLSLLRKENRQYNDIYLRMDAKISNLISR